MFTDKYSNEDGPSLETCRARHRAAMSGKCSCGKKRDPNPQVKRVGSRTWTSCDRCFGTIKQLT